MVFQICLRSSLILKIATDVFVPYILNSGITMKAGEFFSSIMGEIPLMDTVLQVNS